MNEQSFGVLQPVSTHYDPDQNAWISDCVVFPVRTIGNTKAESIALMNSEMRNLYKRKTGISGRPSTGRKPLGVKVRVAAREYLDWCQNQLGLQSKAETLELMIFDFHARLREKTQSS